uniref:Uncharacterized protein n=1 Tax=Anopheles atroparvus TaxID=41427 RepID=A0A182IRU3_ANOAO
LKMQSSDESIAPMVDVTLVCQPKQEAPAKITENLPGGTISPRDYHRYSPVQFPPQVLCFPRKVRFYAPHLRMRPYYVPHRTRTKSESSDPSNHAIIQDALPGVSINSIASSSGTSSLMETGEPTAMMDVSTINVCTAVAGNASAVRYKNPVVLLTKSRSFEDVRADNSVEGSQPSHEMEFVSSRIQKLKVQE